jgi:UDP-N-acetylenolpyruvoylglucosamine reductase
LKKRNTDGSKINEAQIIQMENTEKYKAFKNVASTEKIEAMLMKNTNNVLLAFSNIDENLKIIMDKAEEDKDETYNEASKILEIEHQNVKNLVTSSFQQMKNYISAMKACQKKFLADSPGDFGKAVKQNLNLTALDEGESYFGFEPKEEK